MQRMWCLSTATSSAVPSAAMFDVESRFSALYAVQVAFELRKAQAPAGVAVVTLDCGKVC